MRFRNTDGSYETVSTDRMPKDGEDALDEVRALLMGYVQPEEEPAD